MFIIDLVFGTFFGAIMRFCYVITGNFGWAIVLFTILTRIILFPISLLSQKNSIVMVKIQPALSDLQALYNDDPATLIKEQKALYKKEKYSSIKAILPLLVQIPLIIGVISVINNPTRHLGEGINPYFYGLDLFALPSDLLIPSLAIISTIFLCVMQNKYNVISREQGFFGKWGIAIFLTVFTGWFSFVVAAGVGLYWTLNNLFTVGVLAICNIIYSPKKYIDYENRSLKPKLTKKEKQAARERKKAEKIREKEDMKRFFSVDKEIVFYSEASGFYKYFQGFIDFIMENSDIVVHYLTSDINDQAFQIDNPQFKAYFCSAHGMITTFMKLDSDVVVMTMPDLEVYHYKRSIVKKDIEYIYTDHGMGSFHLTHRKGAIDNYDTIFCYSKNHNEEVRAIEKTYGLPEKTLVNVGFSLVDKLTAAYDKEILNIEVKESLSPVDGAVNKPQILIAPSWQKESILDCCVDELLEQLFKIKAKIILRPHPEFVKRFPGKLKRLSEKYAHKHGNDFEIQTDFSSNSTVYRSDIVITDWSSIAQEFSLTTKKPTLFINTPMKVMNPEWQRIGIEPMDIWIRDKIGHSIDLDKLCRIPEIIDEMLRNNEKYKSSIEDLLCNCLYNFGNAAETGGEYIVKQVMRKRRTKNAEEV